MECFDAHIPVFRHKDAWAQEKHASKDLEAEGEPASRLESARLIRTQDQGPDDLPKEILIVASKLKHYISEKSGMNTSANVMHRLSEMVRVHCDKAIEHARSEGRKTVMDRDFII